MGEKTLIGWTDSTWPGPVAGCDPASEGCDHCFAGAIGRRFAGTKAWPNGFAVTLHPERLEIPLRWRRPRHIFVNSTADVFHPKVPDEYLAKIWAVMAMAPRHTFQVLTKRHARMRALLSSQDFQDLVDRAAANLCAQRGCQPPGPAMWPLPNLHLGVSAETEEWAHRRIPELLETPAVFRFVSFEPLLGPIDLWGPLVPRMGRPRLNYWLSGKPYFPPGEPGSMLSGPLTEKPHLDLVIVGGESGPGARRMDPNWALAMQEQCHQSRVPFFFKQLGSALAREVGAKKSGDNPAEWPWPFTQHYPGRTPQ